MVRLRKSTFTITVVSRQYYYRLYHYNITTSHYYIYFLLYYWNKKSSVIFDLYTKIYLHIISIFILIINKIKYRCGRNTSTFLGLFFSRFFGAKNFKFPIKKKKNWTKFFFFCISDISSSALLQKEKNHYSFYK